MICSKCGAEVAENMLANELRSLSSSSSLWDSRIIVMPRYSSMANARYLPHSVTILKSFKALIQRPAERWIFIPRQSHHRVVGGPQTDIVYAVKIDGVNDVCFVLIRLRG